MASETYKGEFYCVKCKDKRDAEGDIVETNGRRMAKGKCPACGTNLNRILGKLGARSRTQAVAHARARQLV